MKKLIGMTDDILDLQYDDLSRIQIEKEVRLFDKCMRKHWNIPLSDIYDNVDLESCELKLGSGGYGVHRGYYCPDVYGTFAVGGNDRGRILKKKTSRSIVSREFYFSDDGLVLIKAFSDERLDSYIEGVLSVEYIERHGDMEIGLVYDCVAYDPGKLAGIHLCQYDKKGRLLSFRNYDHDGPYSEYSKQIIKYDGDHIRTVDYLCREKFGRRPEYSKKTINLIYNENMEPVHYCHGEHHDDMDPCDIYDITKINRQWYKEFIADK